MKNKILTICSIWIIFTAKVNRASIPFVSDIQEMIGLVTDVSDISMGRHDLTAGNLFRTKIDATLVAVNKLSAQMNELTQTFNLKMEKMMTAMLKDVPRAIQLASLTRKLIDLITRVDELYEDYLFYVSRSGNVTHYTIEEFGRAVTSHKFGDIPDLLKQIYHLFIPGKIDQKDQSILEVMVSSLQNTEKSERCNQLKTAQQRIYDLYETVIVTEIKGFAMSAYAFGMLALHKNESFQTEIERASAQTIERCSQYLLSVYNALDDVGREIFLCDPPEHIRGDTHVELNSIRRVIIHETQVVGDCSSTCGEISHNGVYGAFDQSVGTQYSRSKFYWNPAQPCLGLMNNCYSIGESKFCEMPAGYDKRYNWIESLSGGFMGRWDNCANGSQRHVPTWTDWYTCQVCFCECSDQIAKSKAIRTFSLRPQLADIDNNMIVTGVRFELKDMMIHVQIEEGKLLPLAEIEKSSLRLKELEDFKYLEEGKEGRFVKINGDDQEDLEHGTDYHFIHFHQRDVNLDNVNSPEPGYVVTGLKMSQDPENSKAIQLDLYITPFNYSTGLLVPTDDKPSKWVTHKDMPGHDRSYTERKKQDVRNSKRGDEYTDNLPDSEDFEDIWFGVSNQWPDVSQSTVPFMDRQLVAAYPRVPLDGISLIHRGRKESGGFLAFELRTIGIHDYMNPYIKPEDAVLYQKTYQKITEIIMSDAEK